MSARHVNCLARCAGAMLALCGAARGDAAGGTKAVVDASTMKGKVLCGYQGWFDAPDDGAGRGWVHYGEGKQFAPGHCTIDLWPDVSELDADEKYPTPFRHRDGSTAFVYSPCNRKTVLRHFRWMREYGIDGVFLQRFGSTLKSPKGLRQRDIVTANVRAGAEQFGRTWAMMYDLSGLGPGEIASCVMADWKHLVGEMKITRDARYLHHEGKPLVAVWGVGFSDGRRYTLDECAALIRFLKSDPVYGGNAVMLGVPTGWRTLSRDAVKDPKLLELARQADIVSPWTVGRYRTPEQAARHAKEYIAPDLAWTKKRGLAYLPVVFPGFSWQNLMKARGKRAELGAIPRRKGAFFWSQVAAFKQAGAEQLYVAMFDEIDEGTAIFKCTNDPPVGESAFLTYEGLPSDHYLRLAGKAGAYLRAAPDAPATMPVR